MEYSFFTPSQRWSLLYLVTLHWCYKNDMLVNYLDNRNSNHINLLFLIFFLSIIEVLLNWFDYVTFFFPLFVDQRRAEQGRPSQRKVNTLLYIYLFIYIFFQVRFFNMVMGCEFFYWALKWGRLRRTRRHKRKRKERWKEENKRKEGKMKK